MITPTALADLAREVSPCADDDCERCALARAVLAYEAQCDRQFVEAFNLATAQWAADHVEIPEIEKEAGA